MPAAAAPPSTPWIAAPAPAVLRCLVRPWTLALIPWLAVAGAWRLGPGPLLWPLLGAGLARVALRGHASRSAYVGAAVLGMAVGLLQVRLQGVPELVWVPLLLLPVAVLTRGLVLSEVLTGRARLVLDPRCWRSSEVPPELHAPERPAPTRLLAEAALPPRRPPGMSHREYFALRLAHGRALAALEAPAAPPEPVPDGRELWITEPTERLRALRLVFYQAPAELARLGGQDPVLLEAALTLEDESALALWPVRRWIWAAARTGEPRAQLARGLVLLGQGDRAARTWLTRAASSGLAEAQALLGDLELQGRLGGGRDPRAAATWYLAAARGGHVPSQVALAGIYLERQGGVVRLDEHGPYHWLRLATRSGHEGAGRLLLARARAQVPEAMEAVGVLLEPEEPLAAIAWYAAAAALGHAASRERLLAGARAGHPGATLALGQALSRDEDEVRRLEAAEWLLVALRALDPVPEAYRARGLDPWVWLLNPEPAARPVACLVLGRALQEHLMPSTGEAVVLEVLARALADGSPEARQVLLELGAIAPDAPDPALLRAEQTRRAAAGEAEAHHWLEREAAAGDARSCEALALVHEQLGELDEAAAWFELAATQGHSAAIEALARMDRAGHEGARTALDTLLGFAD